MSEKVDMRALLEVAKCPCCDGSGGRYDNYGNAEQCQWCYERSVAIAAPAPAQHGQVEHERKLFEARMRRVAPGVNLEMIGDRYNDLDTQWKFELWLDRAAQPAQPDASVLSILREARESVRYHKGMQIGHEAGKRHAAELAALIERIDAILDGKGVAK